MWTSKTKKITSIYWISFYLAQWIKICSVQKIDFTLFQASSLPPLGLYHPGRLHHSPQLATLLGTTVVLQLVQSMYFRRHTLQHYCKWTPVKQSEFHKCTEITWGLFVLVHEWQVCAHFHAQLSGRITQPQCWQASSRTPNLLYLYLPVLRNMIPWPLCTRNQVQVHYTAHG